MHDYSRLLEKDMLELLLHLGAKNPREAGVAIKRVREKSLQDLDRLEREAVYFEQFTPVQPQRQRPARMQQTFGRPRSPGYPGYCPRTDQKNYLATWNGTSSGNWSPSPIIGGATSYFSTGSLKQA
ncbi:MAG: hypothetical protein IPJ40_04055 [Saprospirales bacterium]|nr:hypothetical protein [Saprospirales bacterium]